MYETILDYVDEFDYLSKREIYVKFKLLNEKSKYTSYVKVFKFPHFLYLLHAMVYANG